MSPEARIFACGFYTERDRTGPAGKHFNTELERYCNECVPTDYDIRYLDLNSLVATLPIDVSSQAARISDIIRAVLNVTKP